MHRALGLTDGELARIVELLERDPNHFELAVFSLLWSEHCGYKHSALLLRRLPSSGKRVLQGPGENAGVLDLGDGEAVCFKVESHNHPSAVEPFQGAATGVGGILRDIIAMGARPIALLDGLRFAEGDWRFDRAVEGIGHYGNCVGVPTVGGEAVFDDAYADNVLVNAMCVGLVATDRLTRAGATGPGNLVVLYGATTGRDGIGGASVLASAELGEDDADKRPTVQMGDPFTGKKLIEVSVELVESGLVEGLQDCGAAGLASSLSEMARDTGIDLHLDRVPLREEGMEPWEIMISESQERMVAVVRPQMLEAVEALCERWELHHAVIGEVTDSGTLRALWEGDAVGEIPARFLTDECPRYEVERRARPSDTESQAPLAAPAHPAALVELLGSANVRSRAPDLPPLRPPRRLAHRPPAGARCSGAASPPRLPRPRGVARRPGADRAARPPHRRRARRARGGAKRRLCRRRADRADRLPQLRQPGEARDRVGARRGDRGDGTGMRGTRRADRQRQRLPLQRHRGALDPPDAGGRLRRPRARRAAGAEGLAARRRDPARGRLADRASGLRVSGAVRRGGGRLPRLDLAAEAALVDFLWRAAPSCSLVHDVSEGGLAVALAEAAIHSGLGAEVALPDDPRAWFGETGGQAVLACAPEAVDRLLGVPLRRLGTVGGERLLGIPVSELAEAWS